MKRSKTVLLLGSHLAIAAIALLIARPGESGGGEAAGSGPASQAASNKSGGDKVAAGGRTKSGGFQASGTWRGGEYARAWKALRTAKLPTGERIRMQRELLKQWAALDLEAAIEAALGEAWDKDDGEYYDPTGSLLEVFADEFGKDPAGTWEMLRGRQFDVATGMLRHVWIGALGTKDPVFLASKLGELSWRDREKALNSCRRGFKPGTESGEKLFETLARLPEEVVSADDLVAFSTGGRLDGTPDELKQEILSLGPDEQRMAKVLAIQWGRMLASLGVAEIETQLASLPEGLRSEVVWAAFNSTDSAESTLGLATMLADQGAWQKLEQRETTGMIQHIARNGAAQEVADWATTLPVRKETIELFHRSVDRYLNQNMEGAREWLANIPPGVWRDRAYAEYSQQALNAHNNPEASRWALDQIGDTGFKSEAESWRSQWEKRTGWKGN